MTESGLTRRSLLAALGAALAAACAPARSPHVVDPDPFVGVEAELGGRIGVFALDTGSGQHVGHRADERFAMCSTFKWALAAAVLAKLALDERIPYGEPDLLEYAPITRAHVAAGSMSVDALAEAAVTVSDNTAANLLLAKIGGPAAVTRFFRDLGDNVTRLDRTEPTLNRNEPGDPRDTTTPRAMVGAMRRALATDALTPPHRARLIGWLERCQTGRDKLRAGLPATWRAGDKTGSGAHGASNDVAIVWPPKRSPILIASYLSGTSTPSAAHRRIARIVSTRFG